MSEAIEDRIDPNKPAPYDEHWLDKKQPCWVGLPFNHTFTVEQIASGYPDLSPADMDRGRRLFYGEQWDSGVQNDRISKGRPTLTFNMLPQLLARARYNSNIFHNRMVDHDLRTLNKATAILALENVDAQRLYNYQHSVIVEMSMMDPPKLIMTRKEFEKLPVLPRAPLWQRTKSYVRELARRADKSNYLWINPYCWRFSISRGGYWMFLCPLLWFERQGFDPVGSRRVNQIQIGILLKWKRPKSGATAWMYHRTFELSAPQDFTATLH